MGVRVGKVQKKMFFFQIYRCAKTITFLILTSMGVGIKLVRGQDQKRIFLPLIA